MPGSASARPAPPSQERRRPGRVPLAGVLAGALLGGVAGFAIGLLAYPHLPMGPAAVGAPVADTDREQGPPLAVGTFVQADPKDRLHYGSGSATVYERLIRLGEDFAVGPGPKYHLYLVPLRSVDPESRVDESMFVDLGPLRAFAGAQDYPLPAGLAVADFGSLAVWSEQLNLLISPAELHAAP